MGRSFSQCHKIGVNTLLGDSGIGTSFLYKEVLGLAIMSSRDQIEVSENREKIHLVDQSIHLAIFTVYMLLLRDHAWTVPIYHSLNICGRGGVVLSPNKNRVKYVISDTVDNFPY